jgi:L,D-transpeptidase ErfK/SrfK
MLDFTNISNLQDEQSLIPVSDIKNTTSNRNSWAVLQAIKKGFALGFLGAFILLLLSPKIYEWGYVFSIRHKLSVNSSSMNMKQLTKEFRSLGNKVSNLRTKFDYLTPREPYIIINTSENQFTLKKGDKVTHEGVCSTGSYTLLKTVDGDEQWIFKTPRGMLRVQDKLIKPVWKMPDWAFIEDGLPVPAPNAKERFERGVLGDYGLNIGQGYLIHGTLYQRFLGMPVTHGCIRLGDNELKIVYHTLQLGSKVYIY